MRNKHLAIIVLTILLFICCTQGAFAGAPPKDQRAAWLIPLRYFQTNHTIDKICFPDECYYQTDYYSTGMSSASPYVSLRQSPYFPSISQWYAYKNFSSESGTEYIAVVWYYNNWDDFNNGREHLFKYLTRSGTMSNVTLYFEYNETLATYNNTSVEEVKSRQIDAIQYISNSTSGYFVIFDSHFFPGQNYYIAYYGVVESSDLENYSSRLQSIMIPVPQFMDDGAPNEVNLTNPMNVPPELPIWTYIPVGAVGIVAVIRKIRGNN